MSLNCPFGYGQSEPETARVTGTGFIQPVEAVKYSLLGNLGNPRPFILDGEFHKLRRPRVRSGKIQRYLNATSRWRIFHRVVEQVHKGHPQKRAIGAD